MKNAKSTGSIPVSGEATKQKAPYQAPVLRVYGAVSQWTAGNSGNNDGYGVQAAKTSDRALKQSIVRIGTLPCWASILSGSIGPLIQRQRET